MVRYVTGKRELKKECQWGSSVFSFLWDNDQDMESGL